MVVAPTEHEVLVFLCQLVVLVAAARVLGGIARRLGQPAVVGELAAGVVLGPSVFGRVAADPSAWLFPAEAVQGGMLMAVAWLGMMLLLVGAGAETDTRVMGSLGKAVGWVSAGGLVVPLAAGFALGAAMPASLRGPDGGRGAFAAFVGVALAISALPVIAKVLADLGVMRRDVGQITLAAATVNDVVGWLLLGVVASVAGGSGFGAGRLAIALGGVAVLAIVSLTVGQGVVDRLLRRARTGPDPTVSGAATVVLLALGLGVVTHQLGVESVLGAFLAGVILGRSRFLDETALRLVEVITRSVLAPLFFATAGLRADLGLLREGEVLGWSGAVLGVAVAGKLVGGVVGGRLAHLPGRECLAVGVALNARGALEIVIASVGLRLGVLNPASYTAVVLMAVATSAMAPPVLRALLRDWRGTEAEQERLAAEERARGSIVVSHRPVLVPTRGHPPSIIAAQVLDLAWPPDVPVTVVTVGDADAGVVLDVVGERAARIVRVRAAADAAGAVLTEAAAGHGAVVLGIPDRAGEARSPFVQRVVGLSPVPVVLVRRERITGAHLPPAFGRSLVLVDGSTTSRAAQEVALHLGARLGTHVHLAHVDAGPDPFDGPTIAARRALIADRFVTEARELAVALGATTSVVSRMGESAGELLAAGVEHEVDLVVVGAERRPAGPDDAFLGHVAEHLIDHCPATVAVVVLPTGWTRL